MTKKYIVYVRETWVQGVAVEAEDRLEAIVKVEEGEGEYLPNNFEYSDTRDKSEWTIEEILK